MTDPALFPFDDEIEEDVGRVVWPGKTSVYRLYDQGGCLLYVGITSTGTRRFAQHRDDQPWFDDVTSATFEHFETRHEALAREAWAIRAEHPIHNKALNARPGVHPVRLCGGVKKQRCKHGRNLLAAERDLLALPHCCDWMRSRRQHRMEERDALAAARATPEAMCGRCRQEEALPS